MSPQYTQQIMELNAEFDPLEVLQKMGIEGDAIYIEGNQIRLYCPIHRDIVKRSMIVDAEKRTYYCQHKQCDAHQGGPLIELYANFYGISIDETIEHLKSGPMDQSQLVMEADKLIDRGELSSAIPMLQKVLDSDPTNAINRCKLAALYLELGTKDEGFQEYLRSAEDFAVRGQLDKTVSIYKLLLIISPNNVMLRHNLFHIFMRLKMPDQAVEQLKYAADFLFQRKEYEQTLRVCKEMLEATPVEPSVREFYARVLEAKGKTFEAAQEAETAAKLYFELDRLRESSAALEFGLKLQPGNRILLELRKELERRRQSVRGGFDETSVTGREAMSEEDFENWLKDIEDEVDGVEQLIPDMSPVQQEVAADMHPADQFFEEPYPSEPAPAKPESVEQPSMDLPPDEPEPLVAEFSPDDTAPAQPVMPAFTQSPFEAPSSKVDEQDAPPVEVFSEDAPPVDLGAPVEVEPSPAVEEAPAKEVDVGAFELESQPVDQAELLRREAEAAANETPFSVEAPYIPEELSVENPAPSPAAKDEEFVIDMSEELPEPVAPRDKLAPDDTQPRKMEFAPLTGRRGAANDIAPSEIPLPDINSQGADDKKPGEKSTPRKLSQVPFGRPTSVFDLNLKAKRKVVMNDALNDYVFELDEKQLQRTGLYLAEVMSKVRVSHSEGVLEQEDMRQIEQFYDSFRAAREAAYIRHHQ